MEPTSFQKPNISQVAASVAKVVAVVILIAVGYGIVQQHRGPSSSSLHSEARFATVRSDDVIDVIVERNPHPDYDYGFMIDGQLIPLQLSRGERYVNQTVRMWRTFTDRKAGRFVIDRIEVID